MGSEIAHAEASPPESAVPAVVATAPEQAGNGSPVLERMFRMAERYRAEGLSRQAAEIYFTLLERHGGAPQAPSALGRLLEIAQEYENAGERHQARGIYERLL